MPPGWQVTFDFERMHLRHPLQHTDAGVAAAMRDGGIRSTHITLDILVKVRFAFVVAIGSPSVRCSSIAARVCTSLAMSSSRLLARALLGGTYMSPLMPLPLSEREARRAFSACRCSCAC